MLVEKIPAIKDDMVNVVIETPRGSIYKYTYEPEQDIFVLNKTMPLGSSFPFDFGFIPNTMAEDGDPVDVLVMMNEPAYPGSLVSCRLVGVLEAMQRERDGKENKNDRLVAVPATSVLYADIKKLEDLGKSIKEQIEKFFINYNEQAGKKFSPIKWSDGEKAMELVQESCRKKQVL